MRPINRIVLWLFVAFICVGGVDGALTDDVAFHYTCDDGTISGTTIDSATGINDGTLYKTINTSSTAVIGESCHITTTDNYILALTDQTTITLNFWLNFVSGDSGNRIYETSNDDFAYYETTNTITWFDDSTFHIGKGTIPPNGWIMNTIMKNTTGIYWYQNASYIWKIANAKFFFSGNLYLGNREGRDRGIVSYWDSITLWNRSLTLEEINEVYDAERIGSSYAYGWGAFPSPSVEFLSPANNSHINSVASNGVNISVSLNNMSSSCTLWRTISGTGSSTSLATFSAITGIHNYSDTDYPSDWNGSNHTVYTVNCVGDNESTAITVYVDNVMPSLQYDSSSISWDNSSVYYSPRDGAALSFNVTWRDQFIFKVKTRVFNGSGHTILTNMSGELDGVTSFFSPMLLNISGHDKAQTFTLLFEATDSSTIQKIKDYKVTKDKETKTLTFDTAEGNQIKIKPLQAHNILDANTQKSKDRYSFEYDLKTKGGYLDFVVECSGELFPQYNTGKEGHFVCLSDDMTGNWIDFEDVGKITRSKKGGEWTVRVYPQTTKLKINSLGGLNYVNYSVTFNLTNYNVTLSWQKLECELGNIPGYSVTAKNPYYVHSTAAGALKYNSSLLLWDEKYNFTLAKPGYYNRTEEHEITGDEYITLTRGYDTLLNITAYGENGTKINAFTASYTHDCGTETNTTTGGGYVHLPGNAGNQEITIKAIGWADRINTVMLSSPYTLYNATVFLGGTFQIFFVDEITQKCVKNVSLQLFGDNQTGNFTTGNDCFVKAEGYVNDFYTLRWKSEKTNDYHERYYFVQITNATFYNLTFWMLNVSSQTLATVYDESNTLLQGAYIKVLRYDIETNAYILREMGKTNFEGKTKLSIDTNKEFYKFYLEYPFGTLVQDTTPAYIYEDEITFRVNLAEKVASNYYKAFGADVSLTYNSATGNYRFNWNDPSSSLIQGCLSIYEKRDYRTEYALINSSCIESVSGTALLSFVNVSGRTYKAVGALDFGSGKITVAEDSISFIEKPPLTGDNAVWMVILLTFCALGVAYWSKGMALALAPVPALAFAFFGWLDVPVPVMMGVELLFISIALYISKE